MESEQSVNGVVDEAMFSVHVKQCWTNVRSENFADDSHEKKNSVGERRED